MKAGVVLDGLERAGAGPQATLFGEVGPPPERAALMRTLDALNGRFGAGTVKVGTAMARPGQREPWAMRREAKSPAYTTSWGELWGVKC